MVAFFAHPNNASILINDFANSYLHAALRVIPRKLLTDSDILI